MGNLPLARIPDRFTEAEFEEFVTKNCPLHPEDVDCKAIFGGLCTPDGFVTRSTMLEFSKATDVFISHEWGYDEDGRSVHDRVRYINSALKQNGIVTWFDEDAEKQHGSEMMGDIERRIEAIENTQVFLVFITKRYIQILSEGDYDVKAPALTPSNNPIQAELAAAVDARTRMYVPDSEIIAKEAKAGKQGKTRSKSANGSTENSAASRRGVSATGSASSTAAGVKKPKFFRSIVPIVLERSLTRPETWGPVLGPLLGTRLKYDFSEFTDYLTDENGNDLSKGVFMSRRTGDNDEMDDKSVRSSAGEDKKVDNVTNSVVNMNIHMMEKQLLDVTRFIRSSVGKSVAKGGPFKNLLDGKVYTPEGLHFKWFKEVCQFDTATCDKYAKAVASLGYESTMKLWRKLELVDGKMYCVEKLKITNKTHIDVIYREMRNNLTENSDKKAQLGIDALMQQMVEQEKLIRRNEADEILRQKEWVNCYLEDDLMRAEDVRSRLAWDTMYRNKNTKTYQNEVTTKLASAIELDNQLREADLMGWECIHSTVMRDAELERLSRMNQMSQCTDLYTAVTLIRGLRERIREKLRADGPPGKESEMGRHEIYKGIKVLCEPLDTDWWRLLEELCAALVMIRELVLCRPDRQKCMGEYGIGKFVVECLPDEITRITNTFTVYTYITQYVDDICPPPADYYRISAPDDLEVRSLKLTPAQAGLSCVRALVNCYPADPESHHVDDSAMESRTIFLLGKCDSVQLVLRLLKMYLNSVKVRGLIVQKFEKITAALAKAAGGAGNRAFRARTYNKINDVDMESENGSSGSSSSSSSNKCSRSHSDGNSSGSDADSVDSTVETQQMESAVAPRVTRSFWFQRPSVFAGGISTEVVGPAAFDRENQADIGTIYTALECLYCLASPDYTHPNRSILEEHEALEVALSACDVVLGEPIVFQWACTLLAMLYSRRVSKSKVNGRLCRLMIESLRRFVDQIAICEYALKTLAFISFVSAAVDIEAYLPAILSGSKALLKKGPVTTAQSYSKSTTKFLQEVAALPLSINLLLYHGDVYSKYLPNNLHALQCAFRAIGNLCYGDVDNKLYFLTKTHIQKHYHATGDYSHTSSMCLIESTLHLVKSEMLRMARTREHYAEKEERLRRLRKLRMDSNRDKGIVTLAGSAEEKAMMGNDGEGSVNTKRIENESQLVLALMSEYFHALGNVIDFLPIFSYRDDDLFYEISGLLDVYNETILEMPYKVRSGQAYVPQEEEALVEFQVSKGPTSISGDLGAGSVSTLLTNSIEVGGDSASLVQESKFSAGSDVPYFKNEMSQKLHSILVITGYHYAYDSTGVMPRSTKRNYRHQTEYNLPANPDYHAETYGDKTLYWFQRSGGLEAASGTFTLTPHCMAIDKDEKLMLGLPDAELEDKSNADDELDEFQRIDKQVAELMEIKRRKHEEHDLELLRSIGKHPDQLAALQEKSSEDSLGRSKSSKSLLDKKDSSLSLLSGVGSIDSYNSGLGSRADSPELNRVFTEEEEEEIKKLELLTFTRKQILKAGYDGTNYAETLDQLAEKREVALEEAFQKMEDKGQVLDAEDIKKLEEMQISGTIRKELKRSKSEQEVLNRLRAAVIEGARVEQSDIDDNLIFDMTDDHDYLIKDVSQDASEGKGEGGKSMRRTVSFAGLELNEHGMHVAPGADGDDSSRSSQRPTNRSSHSSPGQIRDRSRRRHHDLDAGGEGNTMQFDDNTDNLVTDQAGNTSYKDYGYRYLNESEPEGMWDGAGNWVGADGTIAYYDEDGYPYQQYTESYQETDPGSDYNSHNSQAYEKTSSLGSTYWASGTTQNWSDAGMVSTGGAFENTAYQPTLTVEEYMHQEKRKLELRISERIQNRYGGKMDYIMAGRKPTLTAFEQALVEPEWNGYNPDNFLIENRFYGYDIVTIHLRLIFEKHEPERVKDIDKILHGFKGREGLLIAQLRRKYGLGSDKSYELAMKEGEAYWEIKQNEHWDTERELQYLQEHMDDTGPLAPVQSVLHKTMDGSLEIMESWAAATYIVSQKTLAPNTRLPMSSKDMISKTKVAACIGNMTATQVFCALPLLPRIPHQIYTNFSACNQYNSANNMQKAKVAVAMHLSRQDEQNSLLALSDGEIKATDTFKDIGTVNVQGPGAVAADKTKNAYRESKSQLGSNTIPNASLKHHSLFVQVSGELINNGILEMIVSGMKDSRYCVDVCSTAVPLLAKILYGISFNADTKLLNRFVAIRGAECLVNVLAKNTRRCDIFYWCCKAVLFITQGPFNHSSGVIARLISEGFCDIFMTTWQYLSAEINCKCGNADYGEEFANDPSINGPEICSALCFFTGCETLVAICYNTSSNSSLNSTHNKLNVRLEAQRRGVKNVYSRYGIKEVSSIGDKAVQVMKVRATMFLANLFFQRIRSKLQILEKIRRVGCPAFGKTSAAAALKKAKAAKEGYDASLGQPSTLTGSQALEEATDPEEVDNAAGILGMALAQQGINVLTNEDGVIPFYGKFPIPRRTQLISVLSSEQNEANLRKAFQLFGIDFAKWIEES